MVALEWPDLDFDGFVDRFFESGRLQLTLLVAVYLVVVYLTNRILIASPARLRLEQAIEAEKAECELREAVDPSFRPHAELIRDYADRGLAAISVNRGAKRSPHPLITLAKVHNGRRYLNTAQRLRLRVVDDEERLEVARLAAARLKSETWLHARGTAARIGAVIKRIDNGRFDATAKQQLLVLAPEALKLWLDQDNERLEEAAETQRRTMWLVIVAAGLVYALGLGGHRMVLLIGATGGFLVPLARVRKRRIRSEDHATSWGMLLLGPMAGAIAAFSGLLMIRFLADKDINVLDEALGDVWSQPNDPKTWGLAFVLGFSAPLVGSLAAATSGKLAPTATMPDDETVPEVPELPDDTDEEG